MLLPQNTTILRPYQAQYDSITIVYDVIPLIYASRYHKPGKSFPGAKVRVSELLTWYLDEHISTDFK